jgi:2-methylcitrate dehydratase PrpD
VVLLSGRCHCRRPSPDVNRHIGPRLGDCRRERTQSVILERPCTDACAGGSDVKEGIPWSVVTGLVALGLAEAGHTGPRNILDSALHYRFPDELSLGSSPHICNAYFKLFACCRHVHAPLDALLHLVDQHGIDPNSIDAIEVETYGGALRLPNKSDPTHLVDVQYSIPYCLALAAIVGPQALLALTAEALGHDDVTALARRVILSLDLALDARFPARRWPVLRLLAVATASYPR